VDDIFDTGKTMHFVKEAVKKKMLLCEESSSFEEEERA